MRNYGYKICYKKQGKRKSKIYLVTNNYELALWQIRWYSNHPPDDKKTKRPLNNVEWLVIPIKTYIEYKHLWRGCPF